MKNFKLLAFIAAFSAVTCAQEEETTVQNDFVAFDQEVKADDISVVAVAEEVTDPQVAEDKIVEITTTAHVQVEEEVQVITSEVAQEAKAPEVAEVVPAVETTTPAVEEAVTVAEQVTAPEVAQEVKVVEKITFASMKEKAYNAYTSTTQALSKAANTTADYANASFVKANQACNKANQAMFTVAAEDNSYVAMLKNNATQITLGTLVAAAAVVTTVYVFTNKATQEEQN